ELPRARDHVDAIRLRAPTPADVPALYVIQSDADSNRMAGTKPRTHEAFFAAWDRIFADPKINSRIIEMESELVGSINAFQAPREGRAAPSSVTGVGEAGGEMRDCIGYWIAKAHWGRGIAS